MKKNILLFFSWLLLLTFNVFAEEFSSLHQLMNKSIQISSGSVDNLIGFNEQYNPNNNITACSIGVPNTSTYCSSPGFALLTSFPTFPANTAIKLYIPKGTIGLQYVAFLPQGVHVAIAAKLDEPPIRTTSLSDVEYENYRAIMGRDLIFQDILTGKEQILVHPGGGTFTMLWGYTGGRSHMNPTTEGHWLYLRVINSSEMYNFSGATLIDQAAYKAGYASIQWDINGDPVDTASGGTGGATTPPTSFSITPPPATTLTQGVSSTISITPSSGFTLNSCSAASVSASSYNNNSMMLTPNSANPVTITCTSTTGITATATLQVQAAPITALTTITLSKNSLVSNDVKNTVPTTITVSPNPGAILPMSISPNISGCAAKYNGIESSNIKWITSSTFQLSPDSQLLPSEKIISIDCGGTAKTDFTIKMPLTIGKSATGDALEFNFPSGNTTVADLYIAGYIKDILPNKLTGKVESAWICRSYDDSNWVYMPGAILPRVCKRSGIKVNDKVRITIDATDIAGIGNSSFSEYFFTFSEKTLKDAKVELYGAYTTDNGNSFNFIGDDNTGTFSAQPPVGANINALYIFK